MASVASLAVSESSRASRAILAGQSGASVTEAQMLCHQRDVAVTEARMGALTHHWSNGLGGHAEPVGEGGKAVDVGLTALG